MQNGEVEDFCSEYQQLNAALMFDEKVIFLSQQRRGYYSKYINEPYRFCIFPLLKANQLENCQKFKRQSSNRYLECLFYNCLNCCNHLTNIFQFLAQKSSTSEILKFAYTAGQATIKQLANRNMILQCRQKCEIEYPIQQLQIIETPDKDSTLGTQQNPGYSCVDLLINGTQQRSGIYWIKIGNSVLKVYCDQDTDGGGWTLFFSYNHNSFQNLDLQSGQVPLSPYDSSSHISLNQLEVQPEDVQELRFYCKTNNMNQQMHFKTRNQGIIRTAMSGDQTKMENLSRLEQLPAIENLNLVEFSPGVSGQNPKGGFWDRPFGTENSWWSVGGGFRTWECGDALTSFDGNKYETSHNIYFRGQPPSKESVIQRFLQKIKSQK